jgi:hypothetical protein
VVGGLSHILNIKTIISPNGLAKRLDLFDLEVNFYLLTCGMDNLVDLVDRTDQIAGKIVNPCLCCHICGSLPKPICP